VTFSSFASLCLPPAAVGFVTCHPHQNSLETVSFLFYYVLRLVRNDWSFFRLKKFPVAQKHPGVLF